MHVPVRPALSPAKWLGVLLLATSLGGCVATGGELTSTVASAGGLFSSRASVAAEPLSVPLFVASTRKAERGAAADAASDGKARFSLVMMSVPPGHEPGAIEQPSFGKADPAKHFAALSRNELDGEEFLQQVAIHVSGRVGSNRDVLVFVHGFNNSYDDARLRFTQIVADSGFNGVPVLFTWPSRAKLLAYGSDKESATASRDALEKLLSDLSRTPGVGRVHVLAHSMGSWLAMEALRQNAIAGQANLGGRLGEVMLAAPDLDLAVFEQQMGRIGRASVSVFATTNDRALSLSQTLAGDRARLGNLDVKNAETRAALRKLGVRVYDITDTASGIIKHGAFAEAPQVVAAIGQRLSAPREDRNAQAVLGQRPEPIEAKPSPDAITASPLPPVSAPAPSADVPTL